LQYNTTHSIIVVLSMAAAAAAATAAATTSTSTAGAETNAKKRKSTAAAADDDEAPEFCVRLLHPNAASAAATAAATAAAANHKVDDDAALLPQVAELMRCLFRVVGEDLSFQDVEAELQKLPGKYAATRDGCIIVASHRKQQQQPQRQPQQRQTSATEQKTEQATQAQTDDRKQQGPATKRAKTSAAAALQKARKEEEAEAAGEFEELVGCVCLRALPCSDDDEKDKTGEVKRMFLQAAWRGRTHNLARRLMSALFAEAKRRGYTRLRLDTLKRLKAANVFYERLGFTQIPAYCHNPIKDVVFFEKSIV
jgi:GNAT superfamily N-acetyltransferase